MLPYCLFLVFSLTTATSTKTEEYTSFSPSSSSISDPTSQGGLYYYYQPVQKKSHHDSMYSGSSSTHSYAASPSGSHSYSMRPGPYDSPYGVPQVGTYGLSGLGGYGYLPSYGSPPSYSYSHPQIYASTNYMPHLASYSNYPAPQSNYGGGPNNQNKKYGLTSLIMPMLALAGLGLLIPNFSSNLVGSGRRKRDANDPESVRLQKMDKYLSLYRSAMENEECMNRVVCELGRAMKSVQGKTPMLGLMEDVLPSWMRQKIGIFKAAALTSEVGKCEKYKC